MNLSNHNRCGLIVIVIFMLMSLGVAVGWAPYDYTANKDILKSRSKEVKKPRGAVKAAKVKKEEVVNQLLGEMSKAQDSQAAKQTEDAAGVGKVEAGVKDAGKVEEEAAIEQPFVKAEEPGDTSKTKQKEVASSSQAAKETDAASGQPASGADSVKVNFDFTDVPLNQILVTIAQLTDLNIVGGEAISQKISVHIKDTPLKDVLDIILKTTDYAYVKEDKVLRIVPKAQVPLKTEVFTLKFAFADPISGAVSHLLSSRGSIKAFSQLSQAKYSNMLVVTDSSDSIDSIRTLIDKLDNKVAQVMIEVKFCEVTLGKDDELGIDWVVAASISGASGPTAIPLGNRGQRLYEPPTTVSATSGSITLGTISFTDFKATLHALYKESKVKLLASPQVAAKNGEQAEIIIGDKVPIPLYERNETTGKIEITGYQTENVGVLLKVIPIINSDNTVTLNIHPEVSEITGYTGPNNERPIVSTREITTVFTVKDGSTIVLGGLKKETVNNVNKQIPVLGSIPVIGNLLFRYKDNAGTRKELLVFITPHILLETSEKALKPQEASLR